MEDNTNNEKNLPSVNDDCGCAPGSSCSTETSSGGKKLKSILFILIIVAAMVVAGLSLMSDSTGASDGELSEKLPPVKSYFCDDILADDDFAIIVLAGAGAAEERSQILNDLANQVAAKIRKTGAVVNIASILPGQPLFGRAVDEMEITDLPAVIAVKKGFGPGLIVGEISEKSILQAYVTGCSGSAASCASSGCDPKACTPGEKNDRVDSIGI